MLETKINKHKRRLYIVLAIILGIVMVIVGTFTYSNLLQTATNKLIGSVSNGARLHDDFDEGSAFSMQANNQKQIYVENYGNSPLIVRVKLKEYLEIISIPQGSNGASTAGAITNIITSGSGANKANKDSWTPHIEGVYNPSSLYWEWTSASNTSTGNSIYYLPTENIADASADVDNIIGRYGYSSPNGTGQTAAPYASIPAFNATNISGGGAEIYNATGQAVSSTLSLKRATITMAEWHLTDKPTGNFWIGDTDGWYYWANALQPNTATFPVLQNVNRINDSMEDEYYYGIDVEMQTLTAPERAEFATGGRTITTNGGDLVDLLAGFGAYGIALDGSNIGKTITAGASSFNVLYVDGVNKRALINAKNLYPNPGGARIGSTGINKNWTNLELATSLGGVYFNSLDALLQRQNYPVPTLYSSEVLDNAINYPITNNAKVFILDIMDLRDTLYGENISSPMNGVVVDDTKRTVPGKRFDPSQLINSLNAVHANDRYWTRGTLKQTAAAWVGTVMHSGGIVGWGNGFNSVYGVIVCMWIDLTVFR